MNIETDLLQLKQELENLKIKKAKIEETLNHLENEKVQLIAECKNLNIDPQNIDSYIVEQDALTQKELLDIKRQLDDFRN